MGHGTIEGNGTKLARNKNMFRKETNSSSGKNKKERQNKNTTKQTRIFFKIVDPQVNDHSSTMSMTCLCGNFQGIQ